MVAGVLLVAGVPALAGCGGPSPTPERVQTCLAGRGDVNGADQLVAGSTDVSAITPEQTEALGKALEGATQAISMGSGGPSADTDGVADAPLRITELHFFPDAAAAQRAADVISPTVGPPDQSVLNGVRALGPVLVVHYAIGMGNRPGGITIERDLKPVEDCLREAGYPSS